MDMFFKMSEDDLRKEDKREKWRILEKKETGETGEGRNRKGKQA